jgi:hypothetical protein
MLDLIEESEFNIDLITEFFEYVWRHPYILSVYASFGTIVRQKVAEFKRLVALHDYQKLHDALVNMESLL